jgi:hypothetical protein
MKTSGTRTFRDGPIWVVIHMYMEAVLGISLYRYPYVKLAKMLSFLFLLCLLFNNIGEESRTGSAWKQGNRGENEGSGNRGRYGPNNVCTYE